MSDDILARARAALDGVTEGPWEASSDRLTDWDVWVIGPVQGYDCEYKNAQDARFIAAARSLVPEMADEITRLRAGVKRLRAERDTAWMALNAPRPTMSDDAVLIRRLDKEADATIVEIK